MEHLKYPCINLAKCQEMNERIVWHKSLVAGTKNYSPPPPSFFFSFFSPSFDIYVELSNIFDQLLESFTI